MAVSATASGRLATSCVRFERRLEDLPGGDLVIDETIEHEGYEHEPVDAPCDDGVHRPDHQIDDVVVVEIHRCEPGEQGIADEEPGAPSKTPPQTQGDHRRISRMERGNRGDQIGIEGVVEADGEPSSHDL